MTSSVDPTVKWEKDQEFFEVVKQWTTKKQLESDLQPSQGGSKDAFLAPRSFIIRTPGNFTADAKYANKDGIIENDDSREMAYILEKKFDCTVIAITNKDLLPGLRREVARFGSNIPRKGCSKNGARFWRRAAGHYLEQPSGSAYTGEIAFVKGHPVIAKFDREPAPTADSDSEVIDAQPVENQQRSYVLQ
ncbi:hypothetical protein K491DRAFT_720489 [Lophiostoma macrostomum CBS 122681]|uniref:Uncharacterized protein n=1 Tax=Lophiostoma macrostomum CBS 122681 TaxID=1314788 RepID=A0A6A6SW01_9PLEO|nr:hypothetical protein K491DRAFT_720489 [Lophiostoma macrostomum CBS 122681]